MTARKARRDARRTGLDAQRGTDEHMAVTVAAVSPIDFVKNLTLQSRIGPSKSIPSNWPDQ
jgi:hypothetical protein